MIDPLSTLGVNVLDVPVIPALMSLPSVSNPVSASSQFQMSSVRFDLSSLPEEEVKELVMNTAEAFSLNTDQTLALQNIAEMFVKKNSKEHVTLIHGVFGAGKSFLLSVI